MTGPRHHALIGCSRTPMVIAEIGVNHDGDPAIAGDLVEAAAGLTVYDMCKAIDRDMCLTSARLVHKQGGKSGTWTREDEPTPGNLK